MTKRPARPKNARDRYLEMAAAAIKCAATCRSARDKTVYLTLAKGWEALAAAMDADAQAKKSSPARKAKKKPKSD